MERRHEVLTHGESRLGELPLSTTQVHEAASEIDKAPKLRKLYTGMYVCSAPLVLVCKEGTLSSYHDSSSL